MQHNYPFEIITLNRYLNPGLEFETSDRSWVELSLTCITYTFRTTVHLHVLIYFSLRAHLCTFLRIYICILPTT